MIAITAMALANNPDFNRYRFNQADRTNVNFPGPYGSGSRGVNMRIHCVKECAKRLAAKKMARASRKRNRR